MSSFSLLIYIDLAPACVARPKVILANKKGSIADYRLAFAMLAPEAGQTNELRRRRRRR